MENIEECQKVEKYIDVDINDFKRQLKEKIEEKYGGVGAFFRSEDSIKLGLQFHDRAYFYDNDAVSIEKLNRVSQFFGGKTIKRKTQIVKVVRYFFEE